MENLGNSRLIVNELNSNYSFRQFALFIEFIHVASANKGLYILKQRSKGLA